MANCHQNFFTASDSFYLKISLDNSKSDSLRGSRDNLRKHIKKKFNEEGRPAIKFYMQGSFVMKTMITPLDGDYDIDDGLYFSPNLNPRPTTETIHQWVVKATQSYSTVDPPIDKKRCVRIPFKAGYHVDYPIYDLIKKDDTNDPEPYLAVKNDGWLFSDPVQISKWFEEQSSGNGGQLRRLVKYFKAWADYENQSTRSKMPSGLVLTILAAEGFKCNDKRDDSAFGNTASSIYERLIENEEIKNPRDSSEDLRERITDAQFANFLNRLNLLIQTAETALNHTSEKEAAKQWEKRLGDRFPIFEDPSNKATKFTSAKVGSAISVNTGSA